jgi:Uma2 family endonuclease
MKDAMLEREELQGTEEEVGRAEENGCEEESPPEKLMGARSSRLTLRIMSRVEHHVEARQLGQTFGPDCAYHLPRDELKKTRAPDGSFVSRGQLPDDRTPDGNLKFAPDFALEVVSPNDTAYEVEEKRVAYLRAGVRLLWIVYPPTQTIFVYRASGTVTVLGKDDTLSGEDVLPEFT